MDSRFRKKVEKLHAKLRRLKTMPAVKRDNLPKDMPESGIYLFSERGKYMYVGRSRSLRQRLLAHGRPSSGSEAATFAFILARKRMGRRRATYSPEGSRQDLLKDPDFGNAFKEAKERVARMDIRFVEEEEPTKQALLEIYAAVALGTPHNDFGTH